MSHARWAIRTRKHISGCGHPVILWNDGSVVSQRCWSGWLRIKCCGAYGLRCREIASITSTMPKRWTDMRAIGFTGIELK